MGSHREPLILNGGRETWLKASAAKRALTAMQNADIIAFLKQHFPASNPTFRTTFLKRPVCVEPYDLLMNALIFVFLYMHEVQLHRNVLPWLAFSILISMLFYVILFVPTPK